MPAKVRLKVMKTNGTVEHYIHTKVIGTLSKALADAGSTDISIAEQLSEAITFFLHKNYHKRKKVTSFEIFSIVNAVLTSTGHHEAAQELEDYHCRRKLKRCRIEVVAVDLAGLSKKILEGEEEALPRTPWNKSEIINDLQAEQGLKKNTARTIAAMVEEKVFSMGITRIQTSLIKQLVLADTVAILRAKLQLAAI